MDALSGMSDDQMALVMCLGAFLGCGMIMSLSYYIGAQSRDDEETRILMDQRQSQGQSAESGRKAA